MGVEVLAPTVDLGITEQGTLLWMKQGGRWEPFVPGVK